MSSKHSSITPIKLIIALIVIVLMVGVVVGREYLVDAAIPQTTQIPTTEPTTVVTANHAAPKLVGNSSLLKVMAQEDSSHTPAYDVARGSVRSELTENEYQSHNSNVPETSKAPLTAEGFVYCPEISLSRELQEFTYSRCVEKNLDYTVVLALMWRESRFDPNAVGYNANGTTDSGIMQINDVNKPWLFNELGISDLMDPYENITAGTELLGRMADQYGMHYGLLAYQYGEQGMKNRVASGITTSSLTELLYTKSAEFDQLIEYNRELESL